MTYQEFLAELEQTPRDWQLRNGAIRRIDENGWQCPLMACAGAYQLDTESNAARLGLDPYVALDIVNSADQKVRYRVRADLLRACGLTEGAA